MVGQPLSHKIMIYSKAKDSDIAELVELTLKFCRATPISETAEISVEKITDIYLRYIVDGEGIVWVVKQNDVIVGFIAGHIGQLAFSVDKTCQTLCWWVKKTKLFFEQAEKLFELFEFDSSVEGAESIIVVNIGPEYSKAIETFYKKKNYKPYETIYIKDLR